MKIDTNVEIINLDGNVLKENDGSGNAVNVTAKKIMANSLMSNVIGRDGRPVPEKGEDKLKKFKLAMKIYDSDEVELSSEDIVLIKERVGATYNTLVYGRICDLLKE